jgi:hypothetical protein
LVTNQGGYHPKDISRAYWQPEQELNRAILPSESTKRDDDKSNKKSRFPKIIGISIHYLSKKQNSLLTLPDMTVFSLKTDFYVKLIQVLYKFYITLV